MFDRREFLVSAAGLGAAVCSLNGTQAARDRAAPGSQPSLPEKGRFPVKVISSANGLQATKLAYQRILNSSDPLDAVVAGVALVESDPNDTSVGYGGLPNEAGVVQLDSAVMHGPTHRAGAVGALEKIKNPAQVAREVMKRTDHVLLVGEGALAFARAVGFHEEDLLTEKARKIWLHWKQNLSDKDDWLSPETDGTDPEVSAFFRAHSERLAGQWRFRRPTGTIHCAGMNEGGDMSCVTTTSGLAFKLPGRVGDSPIIGAGLYVDNEVGTCGSTGRGEANLQNLASFLGVQLMKQGMAPDAAGLEVCRQVAHHTKRHDLLDADGRPNFDLKFYLLDKFGRHAGVTMWGPATYAVTDAQGTRLEACVALYEKKS